MLNLKSLRRHSSFNTEPAATVAAWIRTIVAAGSVLNEARIPYLAIFLIATSFLVPASAAADDAKKIVLIAGPLDSHPKDTHEYERSVILLKHCLETAANLPKMRVEAHFNGWPA